MNNSNDLDVLKEKIGWKEEWKTNKDNVARINSACLLTNHVVLSLSTIFASTLDLLNFLESVVPLGFSLPDNKKFSNIERNTNEKRKKLVRKKTKGEQGLKEFQDFLASPFFPESSVNSSVSGLCSSDLCVGLKLQLETLESERAGQIQKLGDLETLLNSEKSNSALLTRKVRVHSFGT